MIDLKFIRENPETVRVDAAKKGIEIDIDRILEMDKNLRALQVQVQDLQARRNIAAKARDIEEGKKLKGELEGLETQLKVDQATLKSELLKIPNLPLPEVPVGGEEDFEIVKTVGSPRELTFKPKDHLEIGQILDIIDMERAAKVSGARFAYLKNEGVFLELALVHYAMDVLSKQGFSPIIPPTLIRHGEITQGLGYWTPENSTNYYLVENIESIDTDTEDKNNMYLIGTAEHSIVPMHAGETFRASDLPRRYAGFSSAFRRESGSYGKDTRGILRVHQFDKVEMVSFSAVEQDAAELGELIAIAEKFVESLGLSYRVVRLATKDISFPAAETLDIETWMPAQNKYRETHSISTTGQFQSRRLNIKYQEGQEKKFVSILNGTAFAIGRTIISILENFQEEDGTVIIPEVLRPYTGFDKISPKK